VKQQRCARRGGGRGERIEASQRDKFEAAAEKVRSKKKMQKFGFLSKKPARYREQKNR
jgi:hypothetical protein